METTVMVKEIQPSDGNRPHRLIDGNGTEYSTFKDPIIEPAKALVGAQAVVTYTEKQNGNFTNRYLEGITPATPEVAATNGAGTTYDADTTPNVSEQMMKTALLSPGLGALVDKGIITDFQQFKLALCDLATTACAWQPEVAKDKSIPF